MSGNRPARAVRVPQAFRERPKREDPMPAWREQKRRDTAQERARQRDDKGQGNGR